ncbi:MAG TPA: amino acid permease [Polyangiaceae bacterium]|jgi:APA family basic amino acid/polyamine antiporter|nr:amino acid permease [Polyangiaceae bacterium]
MPEPRRGTLGVADTSLIVVGSIVGAGIFLVSPFVAQSVSSPLAFLGVWLLGGGVALAGALTNGELGGLFPRSGGEYVYLREAYGPAFGFLSGWTSFWIAFPGSIAALAAGFGATVAPMLHLQGPHAASAIGVAAVAALTVLNCFGLDAGKWTQNALSAIKLAAFAGLLLLGLVLGEAQGGLVPLVVPGDHPAGVAGALIPVMFAYAGWNAATYVTGEMRDPARGLGKALAIGTGLCVALYVAVNVVYLRAMPLGDLGKATAPAREAATRLGGPGWAAVLSPLIAVCVLSSLHATVLVGPRIYKAMADDGLFPSPFGRVHASTGAPVLALVTQGAISAVQLVSGSFDQLLTFAMFAIVSFSTLTVAAVFVLRARRPDAPRPFRVPGYPVVPALFVVINAWVLWNVLQYGEHGARQALIGVAIVATGVPAYAVFRGKNRIEESR